MLIRSVSFNDKIELIITFDITHGNNREDDWVIFTKRKYKSNAICKWQPWTIKLIYYSNMQ